MFLSYIFFFVISSVSEEMGGWYEEQLLGWFTQLVRKSKELMETLPHVFLKSL